MPSDYYDNVGTNIEFCSQVRRENSKRSDVLEERFVANPSSQFCNQKVFIPSLFSASSLDIKSNRNCKQNAITIEFQTNQFKNQKENRINDVQSYSKNHSMNKFKSGFARGGRKLGKPPDKFSPAILSIILTWLVIFCGGQFNLAKTWLASTMSKEQEARTTWFASNMSQTL